MATAARLGDVKFGGYIAVRAASPGWAGRAPKGMQGGLLLKIMSLVGGGGKAIKYFEFGPEYMFPGARPTVRSGRPGVGPS